MCVGVGVGIFLSISLIRSRKELSLRTLLMVFYLLIIVIALFAPKEFVPTAFDSGGVTTGPMTVPFIMALGVGVSAIRNDKHAADDSFGLVSLCSIGPILAVQLLGVFSHNQLTYTVPDYSVSDDVRVLTAIDVRNGEYDRGEIISQVIADYLPDSVEEFPSPERFMDILRGVGFIDVKAKSQSFGIAHIYQATK